MVASRKCCGEATNTIGCGSQAMLQRLSERADCKRTREDGAGRVPGALAVGYTERGIKERVSKRAAAKGEREKDGVRVRICGGWQVG